MHPAQLYACMHRFYYIYCCVYGCVLLRTVNELHHSSHGWSSSSLTVVGRRGTWSSSEAVGEAAPLSSDIEAVHGGQ